MPRPSRRTLCRALAQHVTQLQGPLDRLGKLSDRNPSGLASFCAAVHEEADFAVEDFVWAAVLCRRLRIAAHVNQLSVPPHLTPARQALIGLYLSQAQMWDEPLDHGVWCRFTGGHSFPTFVSWVFDFAAIVDYDLLMVPSAPDAVCAQHVLFALADSASVRDGVRREAQFVHSACRDAGRSVTPIADWLDDVSTSIKNIVVPSTGKAARPRARVHSATSAGSSSSLRRRSTTTYAARESRKSSSTHRQQHRRGSVTSTSRREHSREKRARSDAVAHVPTSSSKTIASLSQSIGSRISSRSSRMALSSVSSRSRHR